jgi:hypothetical protein
MTWQWLVQNANSVLLDANAVICLLIAGRLMFFQRNGRQRRVLVSVFAYGVILASAYTAFRIIFGKYTHADPSEILLNFTFLVVLFRSGGNLAQLARS